MRKVFMTIMCLAITIPPALRAQSNQTVISVESRLGYSSNTYLNPFFGEWDPSLNSSYGLINGFVQSSFFNNRRVLDVTGGVVIEPILGNRTAWKGGVGLLNYDREISYPWRMGVEAGGSYFSGSFERGSLWIQPYVSWFPSYFTSLKLKAGSNFQSYAKFGDISNSSRRLDTYGLEFETWPSHNWQIQTNFYGSLDVLPSFQEQFSMNLNLAYTFMNGFNIRLTGGMEQYRFETSTTSDPGGPPIGGSGSGSSTSTTNADRIFRLGLTADMPLNKTFSVFVTAEGLKRNNTASGLSENEVQLSGGVRMLFDPEFGRSDFRISPEWKQNDEHSVQMEVRYAGEGRLFLVGDFNQWNQAGIAMIEKSKNIYSVRLNLEAGSYEYKVLHMKGNTREWLEFNDDVYTVEDGFGGRNGMIFVE